MLSRSRNVEYLIRDIEILKSYYNKCSTTSKVQIREKWIFIEIKKLVVSSKCRYLQKAYNILEEDIFKAQNSLNYLKGKSKLLSHLISTVSFISFVLFIKPLYTCI